MAYIVELEDAQKLIPEYEFIERLAPSMQKCAFKAENPRTGETVCVKLISEAANGTRLHREVTLLRAMSHPNVANFYEYVLSVTRNAVRHYMVEAFIEGCDLTDLLGKPWPTDRLKNFFGPMFLGLDALGSAGITHRDLKPSNVRVRADETPVIIDLGLARHDSVFDITRTAEGARIGTPLYFAPEQFRGTKYDIDRRTDLFAAGVLLYEAATGEHPFNFPPVASADALELRVCESEAHYSRPAFVSLANTLQLLIRKLLEKGRERRPNTAGDAAKILGKVT